MAKSSKKLEKVHAIEHILTWQEHGHFDPFKPNTNTIKAIARLVLWNAKASSSSYSIFGYALRISFHYCLANLALSLLNFFVWHHIP